MYIYIHIYIYIYIYILYIHIYIHIKNEAHLLIFKKDLSERLFATYSQQKFSALP